MLLSSSRCDSENENNNSPGRTTRSCYLTTPVCDLVASQSVIHSAVRMVVFAYLLLEWDSLKSTSPAAALWRLIALAYQHIPVLGSLQNLDIWKRGFIKAPHENSTESSIVSSCLSGMLWKRSEICMEFHAVQIIMSQLDTVL